MKVFKTVKKVAKPYVDVQSWVGFDYLASSMTRTVNMVKSLVIPKKLTASQLTDFEEAKKKYNLSETDIAARKQEFKILYYTFLTLLIITFGYTCYLMVKGTIHSIIISLAVNIVLLGQCFRYSFWIFQLNSRKLGCTFKEWLHNFRGKSP